MYLIRVQIKGIKRSLESDNILVKVLSLDKDTVTKLCIAAMNTYALIFAENLQFYRNLKTVSYLRTFAPLH